MYSTKFVHSKFVHKFVHSKTKYASFRPTIINNRIVYYWLRFSCLLCPCRVQSVTSASFVTRVQSVTSSSFVQSSKCHISQFCAESSKCHISELCAESSECHISEFCAESSKCHISEFSAILLMDDKSSSCAGALS